MVCRLFRDRYVPRRPVSVYYHLVPSTKRFYCVSEIIPIWVRPDQRSISSCLWSDPVIFEVLNHPTKSATKDVTLWNDRTSGNVRVMSRTFSHLLVIYNLPS